MPPSSRPRLKIIFFASFLFVNNENKKFEVFLSLTFSFRDIKKSSIGWQKKKEKITRKDRATFPPHTKNLVNFFITIILFVFV